MIVLSIRLKVAHIIHRIAFYIFNRIKSKMTSFKCRYHPTYSTRCQIKIHWKICSWKMQENHPLKNPSIQLSISNNSLVRNGKVNVNIKSSTCVGWMGFGKIKNENTQQWINMMEKIIKKTNKNIPFAPTTIDLAFIS